MTNLENAQQALYDHVEFTEDWTIYPIDDKTDMFWEVTVNEREVNFGPSADEVDMYSDEIIHHRFYPKSVYRGVEMTMIIVDTQCDGNKFFAFFDNEKEIKNELS